MKLKKTVISSAKDVKELIDKYKFCYMPFECRTMKTATSMQTAKLLNCKHVLFITTASAIKDVLKDYTDFGFDKHFEITVIPYTSLHKLDLNINYDLRILDECHKICADPKYKPNATTTKLLKINHAIPTILMSATPDTEGSGLVYWQCQICKYAPFYGMKWREWVQNYVNVKEINTGKFITHSYKIGKTELVDKLLNKYKLTKTQEEAGFIEYKKIITPLYSQLNDKQIAVSRLLQKHNRKTLLNVKSGNVILFKDGSQIVIKSMASRNNKLHQISGGTLIVEKNLEKETKLISNNKAASIYDDFLDKKHNKAVIIYVYKAELELLTLFFKSFMTTDITEFKENPLKRFLIKQQTAVATGVNLAIADVMYLYSFNYSATTYMQVIERLAHVDKTKPVLINVCLTAGGIDNKIYDCLKNKKSFGERHYV